MQAEPESLLSTEAAARRLGLSASTLAKARLSGSGPPYIKLGSAVRYRARDLDAFIDARLRRSTSETPSGPADDGAP